MNSKHDEYQRWKKMNMLVLNRHNEPQSLTCVEMFLLCTKNKCAQMYCYILVQAVSVDFKSLDQSKQMLWHYFSYYTKYSWAQVG